MRSSPSPATAPLPEVRNVLEQVLVFLGAIGLPVRRVPTAHGFLPGVRIVAGGLDIAPHALPSDVLHEAGHLAVLPAPWRAQAQDDVDAVIATMLADIDWTDPDAPLCRAAMQAGEVEATAWAWAAGMHLGLAPEVVITDPDYQGQGATQRLLLAMGTHLGIHGLARAGFCGHGRLAQHRGLCGYPQLAFWLQGGPATGAMPPGPQTLDLDPSPGVCWPTTAVWPLGPDPLS